MELGSNFELDVSNLHSTDNHIFNYLKPYYTYFTDSGRSASAVLNTILKPGVILMPSYICASVIRVYQEKFSIVFYKIKKDFSIDMDDFEEKIKEDISVVYVMHYFGQIQNRVFLNYLSEKKKQYGFTIIEDMTHSIFTKKKTIGDYCICSLRKWFPVLDGGILYSEKEMENIGIECVPAKEPSAVLEAMVLKKLYIQGVLECNELYRRIFTEEERMLDRQKEIYRISELSRSLLGYYSVSELVRRRNKNYQILKKSLLEQGIELVLKDGEFVPLVCPVYIQDRDGFRQYLAAHRVYCAVHWPLAETTLEDDEDAREMSAHILSLPVDQRYGDEHMKFLVETIKGYVRSR